MEQIAASAIRFVRLFDAVEMRIVNRFDILYGPGNLEVPMAIEIGEVRHGHPFLSENEIGEFKKRCIEKYVPAGDGVDGTVEHYACGDGITRRWVHKVGA